MNAEHVLAEFLADRPAVAQLIPAREPTFADLSRNLSPGLTDRLREAGFGKFYRHQAEAIDAALMGRDVMVVTGTSSGKSLCYNVPVLNNCYSEPLARALYLFPTKALAQDQLGKLETLLEGSGARAGTYDGDTPKTQRSALRKEAQVILTNPDMLHLGILPQHELWTKFFRSLRTIVVDEAHTYRGVFGGHVGWILRRLLRMCEWHGSHPQVIACSATVSAPDELFRHLIGREAVVVDQDGAPAGEKAVFIVEPPALEAGAGDEKPRSPNVDAARLLADLAARGIKTMVFCRARISVELVVRTARKYLVGKGLDPALVDSYRGGYTPEERRDIEQRLFRGELVGIATTNAMELGVDVGGLDAVVINGYPGRISSFWQQMGRAGRSGRSGLTVMLSHADPLEQFLSTHPESLFSTDVEPSTPSFLNPYIALAQLKCAAYERPVSQDELFSWGVEQVADEAIEAEEFHVSRERLYYPSHDAPAGKVNIRGGGTDSVRLMVGRELLGEMERWRSLRNAHEGAVYMHRGETYVVQELDLTKGLAHLEAAQVDFFTAPIIQSVIEPGVVLKESGLQDVIVQFLGLETTTAVMGFRRMRLDGQTVLDESPLILPPQTFSTTGLRFDFGEVRMPLADPDSMAIAHTLEHVLASLAPLRAGCDRRDLGSAWYAVAPDTLRSTVYLFDDTPGGLGFCDVLYEQVRALLADAADLLESCSCEDGCPLCVFSSLCESGNEPLGKFLTLRYLQSLLR